ncbi:MAG: hypothetical protein JO033_01455 [Acidobacteriaceae bacterium]|nr:hypothetical protein [Acidobacteriaceae bacterium]MBV9499474.1 hypothetical protein [Acidobacteriaceae bacterium]
MNGRNLEELWKSQIVDTGTKGEQMRRIVLEKTATFDRMIRLRNETEILAALLVVAAFSYFAWLQRNGLERAGSIVIIAGALWIVYYILRHGAGPEDPSPDQTISSYQRALVRKYEHQIRLLRKVKFWYLAPLYIGLLTGSVGILREHAKQGTVGWADAILPLLYTLVFAGVWWLNEVYSVRKLQRWRAQVLAGAEGETQC